MDSMSMEHNQIHILLDAIVNQCTQISFVECSRILISYMSIPILF